MVILRLAFLLLLAYVFQASSLSFIFPVQALSLLAFFYLERKESPYVATVAGLVRDLLLGVPLGTYGLSLTLSSVIVLKLRRELNPQGKGIFLFILFFLFLRDLIAWPVLSIFSYPPKFYIWGYMATIIFYIPVYLKHERKN